MARIRRLIGIATLGVLLAGCVPQEKYEGLKLERDRLAEQLGKSQAETDRANAQAEVLRHQMGAFEGLGNDNKAEVSNLSSQNANLQKQLEEINARYRDAIALTAKAGSTALPVHLSNELSNLAAQNPDLLTFDASHGVVKFKSDVTFSPGSAVVLPKADEVLRRFSQILESSSADHYELLVAGHTDNVPVHNPATIRQGNKDNWYLSANRAIGVAHQLLADGVKARRLGVVGYADERPIASNSTAAGRAQNRRVEVLILPSSPRMNTSMDEQPSSSSHRRSMSRSHHQAPAPVEMNKDAGNNERPGMNK